MLGFKTTVAKTSEKLQRMNSEKTPQYTLAHWVWGRHDRDQKVQQARLSSDIFLV